MQWKHLLLVLSVFLVGACSTQSGARHPLANRGILPLSTTNPYLGSNLFIGAEAERSKHLYYFLKNRGAPVAIELEEKRFSPPRLLMYYPRNKEVYLADLTQDPQHYEWVVTGPFAIERADFRSLAELSTSMQGEPVFMVRGQRHKFRFEQSEKPKQMVIPILPPPPPKPKVIKKAAVKPVDDGAKTEAKSPSPITDFKPLSSDQQAILISKGFAERDTNGDVIHVVKSDSETANQVAKWYTGSEANAQEILSLNGIVTPHLVTGARIIIPLKLLKNTKAMPKDEGAAPLPTPSLTSAPPSH